jgi:hypothetical protein
LGRFDREDRPSGVPSSLGTATQDLRATVEEKLREIVEAAEARAHEIEDRALAQALEVEQDSEQHARQRFQTATERAEQMLTAIEEFEREVAEAFRTLREKGEALTIELGGQQPSQPLADAPVAEPPPVVESAVDAPTVEAAAVEVPPAKGGKVASPEPSAEAPPGAATATPEDDVREGVRRRILDMFLAGEPRGEAERMLARIEDGTRHIDLLDEVYEGRAETQQGSRRRRGGRRRRRPGSAE